MYCWSFRITSYYKSPVKPLNCLNLFLIDRLTCWQCTWSNSKQAELKSAVLISLRHLYTVKPDRHWLYHCGDEGLLWKPWGLNANRSLMLLGRLASKLRPKKNPTLSSNKGQKLAACSNAKEEEGVDQQWELMAEQWGGYPTPGGWRREIVKVASCCYVWCDDGTENGRQVCRSESLSTPLTVPCQSPWPLLDHCHVRDGGGRKGHNTMRAQYCRGSRLLRDSDSTDCWLTHSGLSCHFTLIT